jgi:hypothetical protein
MLLPYLVLLACFFIPSELIVTHFRIDETSVQVSPFLFKTILYGYESKLILLFIILTFLIHGISFIKKFFLIEFLMIFLTLIWLICAAFLLYFNQTYSGIGFYFCLFASGYIIFLNLKKRFG